MVGRLEFVSEGERKHIAFPVGVFDGYGDAHFVGHLPGNTAEVLGEDVRIGKIYAPGFRLIPYPNAGNMTVMHGDERVHFRIVDRRLIVHISRTQGPAGSQHIFGTEIQAVNVSISFMVIDKRIGRVIGILDKNLVVGAPKGAHNSGFQNPVFRRAERKAGGNAVRQGNRAFGVPAVDIKFRETVGPGINAK